MNNLQENKYDSIIIGAGLGGLTAAALLAKRGKKVLVLDKHYLAGGYATEFKRKKYIFDVALHLLSGAEKGGGIHDVLEVIGLNDKIKLIKPDYLFEVYYSKKNLGPLKFPNGDLKKVREHLLEVFPDAKSDINYWLRVLRWVRFQIRVFDNRKTNIIRNIVTMFFAPLLCPILIFGNRIKLSFFLNKVKNEDLRDYLDQLSGYYGLPAKEINSQYYLLPTSSYVLDGGTYLEGGGQELSNQLVKYIEEHNGTVSLKNEALEILVEGDKVTGVKAKKDTYQSEMVVSNASPYIVYENLLKNWPGRESIIKKIRALKPSMSCSGLYLGIDTTIENLNPDFKDSYQVFLNSNGIDTQYEMAKNMDKFKDYEDGCLTFHSNIDTHCCPEGKSVLIFFMLDEIDRWENLSKEEYKEKKKEEQEKVLRLMEKYLPKIRDHIEVAEFATPKTMVRYTGNERGAIYGFAQTPEQGGLMKRFQPKSPLKGLFFSSAWTFPGGGFEGAIRAAYFLVEDKMNVRNRIINVVVFIIILLAMGSRFIIKFIKGLM